MSEMSVHEIETTFQNFRCIENICKEWRVSIDEVEKALPKNADIRIVTELRSLLKLVLNQSRLKEAACETDMPVSVYLSLEQSFSHDVSDNTSLREDRPLTKEEFMQRATSRIQMNLFDETEVVVLSSPQNIDGYEEEIGYPRG